MNETQTRTHSATWLSLVPGTRVDACDASGRRWSGTIEVTHHELGLVWICDHLGERKILDIHVHTLLRLVPGEKPQQTTQHRRNVHRGRP